MIKTHSFKNIFSSAVIVFLMTGMFHYCPCAMAADSHLSMDCCKTMPHCDPKIAGVKETKLFVTPANAFAVYKAQNIFLGKAPFFISPVNNSVELLFSPLYTSSPPVPIFIRDLNLRF